MKVAFSAALLLSGFGCGSGEEAKVSTQANAPSGEVNVYSGRHYDSDRVLFDKFEKETGIKVNLIEAGGDALIERIAREGEATPADLFITADAGILWRGEQRDIFKPIDDDAILSRVPANLRDDADLWVGVSKRARIIIYNKEQGLPNDLSTYEGLADPALNGMVCIRSSSNIYNQSLLASIIARLGEEAAEVWAKGVVANFARKPQGNDTAQINAVASGQCRVAVVNSYYVARFIGSEDPEASAIGDKIDVVFPNQETSGTHVNVSGAGLTKFGPNSDNAEALIAFLLRDDSQKIFALGNNEYPIVAGVSASGPVGLLGDFDEDTLPVAALGENQSAAVKIFDRAGWQ